MIITDQSSYTKFNIMSAAGRLTEAHGSFDVKDLLPGGIHDGVVWGENTASKTHQQCKIVH